METLIAIHTRRSVGKVKPESVPQVIIEILLSAAVQAPNHYSVRPWRFVVLTGKSREKLGDVMAASQRDRFPDLPPEGSDKTRALPLRAPVVIAVGVEKASDPRAVEIENICAVAAACENILLAAHDQGLAAKWRTGEWAIDAKVKEFLGFDADQLLLAFLYIGYMEVAPEPTGRPSFEDRTTWFE